jgi:putative ABC transport system substrate-binding protein
VNKYMTRRDVLSLLGGASASAAWPLAARSQQPPVVGVLSGTSRDARLLDAVKQGLAETGFVEGKNVAFEYRFAEGQFDKLPAMAADLVSRKVAAIVGMQSPTAPIAAKATSSTIPVVFSIGGDPVKLGLVASLNRPGGNVTGATFLVNSLGAKRLEVLRELVPNAKLVGLLTNPKNPSSASEIKDVQEAAQTLGLQLHLERASSVEDIDAAFAGFVKQGVAGLAFAADSVFNAQRAQIIALAARHKLPTVYFYREFAVAGGLASYGGFDTEAYRAAGVYAGRILKGEKPADLPVQQVTKVELIINMNTAKTLGLTLPITLLGRAEEVIE